MNSRGLLPPADVPYPASLSDVHQRFVREAPFPSERQRVFDALALYASLVWERLPSAKLRIDGGFVTHKAWAAPADADVVVVLDENCTEDGLDAALEAPLFTVLSMTGTVTGVRVSLPKAHVMGGLIDAFPTHSTAPASLAFWHDFWSKVTGQDKTELPGVRKGYVEVSNPDA